jgi:hypothetical protein
MNKDILICKHICNLCEIIKDLEEGVLFKEDFDVDTLNRLRKLLID